MIPAVLSTKATGIGSLEVSFSSGDILSSSSWVIPQQYLVSARLDGVSTDAPLFKPPPIPRIPSRAGPSLASNLEAVGTSFVGILTTPLRPSNCLTAAVKLPWIWSLIGVAIPSNDGSRSLMSYTLVSMP